MAQAANRGSKGIAIEAAAARPGVIGRVTELHGTYYHEAWALDLRFEAEVARELADFVEAFREDRDGLWVARYGATVVGAVAIDGGQAGARDEPGTARLRWFIVASGYQGAGLGKRLLDEALDFCRARDYRQVVLRTFAGLDAARRLYEAAGFVLIGEHAHAGWGPPLTHQTFRLDF